MSINPGFKTCEGNMKRGENMFFFLGGFRGGGKREEIGEKQERIFTG